MSDEWIAPLARQSADFSSAGDEQRVRGALEPGEVITYACAGAMKNQNTGKEMKGLVALTDRRVVLIVKPGMFNSDPAHLAIPFSTITNAGYLKNDPNSVAILWDNGQLESHLIRFVAPPSPGYAQVFGTAVRTAVGLD